MKLLLTVTLLIASFLFNAQVDATDLKKKITLTPRGEQKRCPEKALLCVFVNGKICFDPNNGGTCCDDGSGFCSGGFFCGTGNAINYCCEPGITMEQCAAAKSAGTATATYVEPTVVPT